MSWAIHFPKYYSWMGTGVKIPWLVAMEELESLKFIPGCIWCHCHVAVGRDNRQLSVSLGKSLKAWSPQGAHWECLQHCRNNLSDLTTLLCERGHGLPALGIKPLSFLVLRYIFSGWVLEVNYRSHHFKINVMISIWSTLFWYISNSRDLSGYP